MFVVTVKIIWHFYINSKTFFAANLDFNKPCFYRETCFAAGTRVSLKNENSVTLSVLSVLIRRFTLRLLGLAVDFSQNK